MHNLLVLLCLDFPWQWLLRQSMQRWWEEWLRLPLQEPVWSSGPEVSSSKDYPCLLWFHLLLWLHHPHLPSKETFRLIHLHLPFRSVMEETVVEYESQKTSFLFSNTLSKSRMNHLVKKCSIECSLRSQMVSVIDIKKNVCFSDMLLIASILSLFRNAEGWSKDDQQTMSLHFSLLFLPSRQVIIRRSTTQVSDIVTQEEKDERL